MTAIPITPEYYLYNQALLLPVVSNFCFSTAPLPTLNVLVSTVIFHTCSAEIASSFWEGLFL